MYLSEITLQNFKGIKGLNITFNKGVNLIIGNNGAGKTSLLNGISVALSNMMRLLPVNSFVNIEQSDVYAETTRMGDVTSSTVYHTPVRVEAHVNNNNTVYACEVIKNTEAAPTEIVSYPALENMKKLVDQKLPLPLLNYQNAGRGSSVVYEDKTIYGVQATYRSIDRLAGYKDSFAKTMNFYEIQAWCMQMELITIQKKKLIREYSLFKQMISSFIQAIENKSATLDVYYSFESSGLVFVDGNKELPFYNLSAGYQNVLCMAMELAYRSAVLNPELANAKDTEGIVLIDEIEMHLHPAWQWKIVGALQKTFPNVQFIIATHSPIILSSAKDSSLYLMKSVDEIMTLDNVFGYKINDILLLSQGSADIPEEISAWYDKVERLLDAGDSAGLDSLRADVIAAYGKDSQVTKAINDFIEVNKWIEEA